MNAMVQINPGDKVFMTSYEGLAPCRVTAIKIDMHGNRTAIAEMLQNCYPYRKGETIEALTRECVHPMSIVRNRRGKIIDIVRNV